MEEKENEGHILIVNFYKKYIQPFLALFIFVLLFMAVNGLSDYKNLQEEISENCGWTDEAYRCYCQEKDVLGIEEVLNNFPTLNNLPLNSNNLSGLPN